MNAFPIFLDLAGHTALVFGGGSEAAAKLRLLPKTTARVGTARLTVLHPEAGALRRADPLGGLHGADPDACCDLRKTRPLQDALSGFDSWITGRSASRAPPCAPDEDPRGGRWRGRAKAECGIHLGPGGRWERRAE